MRLVARVVVGSVPVDSCHANTCGWIGTSKMHINISCNGLVCSVLTARNLCVNAVEIPVDRDSMFLTSSDVADLNNYVDCAPYREMGGDVNRCEIGVNRARGHCGDDIFRCGTGRADRCDGYLREIVDRWCESGLEDRWQHTGEAIFAQEGGGATGGDADEHYAQDTAHDAPRSDLSLRPVARHR